MKNSRYEELENYLHIINKVAQRHLNEAVAELEGKDIILTLDELTELIGKPQSIVIEGNDVDD